MRQAGVAELADALDSGSSGSNLVEVQVLSPAFFLKKGYRLLSVSLFCYTRINKEVIVFMKKFL